MTESKDTTARFVAAFNAHDEKALNELHSDDIKFNAPGGFKATNAKDATAYATTWLKAFPDGKMKVRSEITSGPWVVQ
ncbi:MAG: ester cyclase, partial [Chloroflexi bacterium]